MRIPPPVLCCNCRHRLAVQGGPCLAQAAVRRKGGKRVTRVAMRDWQRPLIHVGNSRRGQ